MKLFIGSYKYQNYGDKKPTKEFYVAKGARIIAGSFRSWGSADKWRKEQKK